MEQLERIQDFAGMVKEVPDEAGEQEEPEADKISSMLEKLSKGIHELYQAVRPGQSQATSLPIQDEVRGKSDEQTPKKPKVAFQIVQDSEEIAFKSNEAIVQFCREAGKKGAEFGKLGGRPQKVKESALSAEDQIVQAQVGLDENRAMRIVKAVERDESFGYQAKARFCEVWEEALKIVNDEEN